MAVLSTIALLRTILTVLDSFPFETTMVVFSLDVFAVLCYLVFYITNHKQNGCNNGTKSALLSDEYFHSS